MTPDDTKQQIAAFLEAHDIPTPVEAFVAEASNIYHKHEAAIYDARHDGIADMRAVWLNLLERFGTALPARFTALDFGCGTGFASLLALDAFGERIKRLDCYDLSPEMLAACREKIGAENGRKTRFLCGEEGLAELETARYSLAVTNAALHHMLDLEATFHLIDRVLEPGGVYIAGHEPNARFYKNAALVRASKRFSAYKRLKRRFTREFWARKLGRSETWVSVENRTAREMLERGLIPKPLPAGAIPKLVDIHVPIGFDADRQRWGVNGFSGEMIVTRYLTNFELLGFLSYGHIKDNTVRRDPIWRRVEARLAHRHPHDGADCAMVFQKKTHRPD